MATPVLASFFKMHKEKCKLVGCYGQQHYFSFAIFFLVNHSHKCFNVYIHFKSLRQPKTNLSHYKYEICHCLTHSENATWKCYCANPLHLILDLIDLEKYPKPKKVGENSWLVEMFQVSDKVNMTARSLACYEGVIHNGIRHALFWQVFFKG